MAKSAVKKVGKKGSSSGSSSKKKAAAAAVNKKKKEERMFSTSDQRRIQRARAGAKTEEHGVSKEHNEELRKITANLIVQACLFAAAEKRKQVTPQDIQNGARHVKGMPSILVE